MHVVLVVAGVPEQAVRSDGPEDEFERLADVAVQVGARQALQVVPDPRVAVEVVVVVWPPGRRRRRCCRRRGCGRYAVNFDIVRKRVSQQKIQKIHVVR